MNDVNSIKIAYFSAEIGISPSLPTYSGGLGVLAGDHIKAATDNNIPIVGITLLYKEGYFKQRVDEEGRQSEVYPRFDPEPRLKQIPEKFTLRLRERDVWVEAYEYIHVGVNGKTVSIYFLDTDLEENFEDDRTISLRLYSGNKDHRILQEAILGFGGIKLLDILGYKNLKTYHMNEGHCSFLTLALLEKFNGDEDKVRKLCHFTTHTPVAAGHDHFSLDRCRKLLHGLLPENLSLPSWVQDSRLHMTELGLYFSESANGVSELHGKVAQDQFPDFEINYITNGVYHPYWLGKSFKDLFDEKLSGWETTPEMLLDLQGISDDELLLAHQLQKKALLEYANSQTQKALSENVLTIGFARRAAEYKRARLIFSDTERLIKLGENKIQIVFAGKAHPKDEAGKEIIKGIVTNANQLMGKIKIIFLENYNMWLGHLITSGVDIWLNTPLRPNEASGTSGMKAALNGIPNLSILDGWWVEGCKHGENGWAIGDPSISKDKSDAEFLYQLLEKEVIPTFYENRLKWANIVRTSITSSVQFTADRMIKEYKKKYYSK
tara:strand:- start:394 stop:2043 length:1650 start_codon:yes stop_codon:yes gene_type:complete